MCIRFKEKDVRTTGRVSMGVIGMRFDEDDEVIGMQMESQGEELLVVSETVWASVRRLRSLSLSSEAERVCSAIR